MHNAIQYECSIIIIKNLKSKAKTSSDVCATTANAATGARDAQSTSESIDRKQRSRRTVVIHSTRFKLIAKSFFLLVFTLVVDLQEPN